MFNLQSKIGNRKLINPLDAFGNKDWQFYHHELGFANGANHARAGRGIPFFRHLFAGVAAPAFDVRVARESPPINFRQLAIVQPRFTSAVDVVAVIEHETGAVRVPEIFKATDLYLIARLTLV